MEGTNENKGRQTGSEPVAANLPAPTQPTNTDEWIHQLMERLSPDEIVVRRPEIG